MQATPLNRRLPHSLVAFTALMRVREKPALVRTTLLRRRARSTTFAVVLASMVMLASLLHAQSPAIDWYRISAGGGASSSASNTVLGTIGQPDVETSRAGKVSLQGGFWSFAAVASVPAEVITWTNLAGGNWTQPKNWSPNRVPGPKEIAAINLPGTYTVTLDYNAQCQTLLLGGAAGVQSLDWAYGTFTGTMVVETNAVVNLLAGSLSLVGKVENRGRIVWPAGRAISWTLAPSSTLWNRSTGLLELQGSGWFYCVVSPGPTINNEGTIRKSSGVGELGTYASVSVVNSGTIEVETGALSLHNLDSSGSISVSKEAVVRLLSGTINFRPGHTFAGTGTWWWAGSPEVNGLLDGDVLFAVSTAGKFNAQLNGNMSWTNGTLSGNLTLGKTGRLNFSTMTLSGLLTNYGQVTWSSPSGSWFWRDSARVENQPGGTFDVAFDQTLSLPAGASFNNRGTLVKSGGTGITYFRGQHTYTNSGLIEVRSGSLEFAHGLTSGGTIDIAQGASLLFRGYDVLLGPSHKFTGLGTCTFGASGLHIAGPLDGTVTFVMDYDAALDATLNAPMSWNYGNQSGGFTVGRNGILTLTTPGMLSGTLTNFGAVLWQNPTSVSWSWGVSARFENTPQGLFDMQGDFSFYGGGIASKVFNNAGTFRKSKGVATAAFHSSYAFTNSGRLEVQSGKIWFRGPYFETASPTIITLIGGVAPIAQYSQVQFDQPPTFAGRFDAILTNGYRPAPGSSFTVLSYPSAVGRFSTMNGVDLGAGLTLNPQFSATTLIFTAVQNASRPALTISAVPGSLRISVPENFPGWQLFSATNLADPVWEPVPVTNGTTVDLPTLKRQEVFRLQGP